MSINIKRIFIAVAVIALGAIALVNVKRKSVVRIEHLQGVVIEVYREYALVGGLENLYVSIRDSSGIVSTVRVGLTADYGRFDGDKIVDYIGIDGLEAVVKFAPGVWGGGFSVIRIPLLWSPTGTPAPSSRTSKPKP